MWGLVFIFSEWTSLKAVPFAFSEEKGTPAWKKYATARLWRLWLISAVPAPCFIWSPSPGPRSESGSWSHCLQRHHHHHAWRDHHHHHHICHHHIVHHHHHHHSNCHHYYQQWMNSTSQTSGPSFRKFTSFLQLSVRLKKTSQSELFPKKRESSVPVLFEPG